MLWWILLPMFWSAVLLVCFGVFLIHRGPSWGRRFRIFTDRGWWVLAAVIAFPLFFVPTCTVVHHITFPFRFGLFDYAAASQIDDRRIRSSIPSTATSVVIYRELNGFEARYEVAEKDLRAHVDQAWERAEEKPHEMAFRRGEEGFGSLRRLPGLDTTPPAHAEPLVGPHRLSWAGWVIWYDPLTRSAWQDAGYW